MRSRAPGLLEQLFSRGIMRMGPCQADPSRQIGVFNPEILRALQALKTSEMEKFRWLAGEWDHENEVPATRLSPAYTDIGSSRFSFNEKDGWISMIGRDGRESPSLTFDPFSKQWIYVLVRGSYGILRSAEGWVEEAISFSGLMTMLGVTCDWRMTWTKDGADEFSFINEERDADGSWVYIDEWRFRRK
jgi:hypothetical protein